MKNRVIIFIVATVGLTLFGYYLHLNFFSKKMIVGTYINTNFDYPSHVAEIPCYADELELYSDGRFSSSYWGEGEYKISYSIKGTTIDLTYNYEFGKAGFNTYITRDVFGTPKIVLNKDRNHHYAKVK